MAGFVITYVLQSDEALQFDGGGYVAHHAASAAYNAGYDGLGTADHAAFLAGQASSAAEVAAQVHTIRDVVGNPFRPVALDPELLKWSDGQVAKLALPVYEERAFDRLPILADALEEA